MSKSSIKISAIGDICLANISGKTAFFDVKKEIAFSDVVFANLESPFSAEKKFSPYGFLMAEPWTVNVLKNLNFNVLSLANNHIADCGYEGLLYTLDLLKKNNISFTGAGENLSVARKPCIVETKNGYSVAVHAYVEQNFGNKEGQEFFTARKNSAGANPLVEANVQEDIANSKKLYDFVMISIHWSGIQGNEYISPQRIKVCERIKKQGANLIVGHHPHIIQGYDCSDKNFTAYGLGNFYFAPYLEPNKKNNIRYWNKKERTSLILKAEFDNNKKLVNHKFIPVIQDKKATAVTKALPSQSKKILERLNYLSKIGKKKTYPIYFLYSVFKKS